MPVLDTGTHVLKDIVSGCDREIECKAQDFMGPSLLQYVPWRRGYPDQVRARRRWMPV